MVGVVAPQPPQPSQRLTPSLARMAAARAPRSGIAPTLVAPIPELMAESFASGHEDITLKFHDTNGQVSEVQPLLAHMLTGPMHGFPSMTALGLAALGFFFE